MIGLVVLVGEKTLDFSVDGDRCTVGSGPRCSVRVAAEGIVHLHLLVRPLGRGFEFVNVGPAGTVRHGGRLVDRGLLVPGDRIEMGGARLLFRFLEPAGRDAPGGRRVVPGAGGGARGPSFEESLFRSVRGASPWVLSGLAHLALALLLMELTPSPRGLDGAGRARVIAAPVFAGMPGLDETVDGGDPGLESPSLPTAEPPPAAPILVTRPESEDPGGESGEDAAGAPAAAGSLDPLGIGWEGGPGTGTRPLPRIGDRGKGDGGGARGRPRHADRTAAPGMIPPCPTSRPCAPPCSAGSRGPKRIPA